MAPAVAGFASAPVGPVTVTVAGDAEPLVLDCRLVNATTEETDLARVAAARRLRTLDREQAAALAEHHQLVSDYTSSPGVRHYIHGHLARESASDGGTGGWGGGNGVAVDVRALCSTPAYRSRSPTPRD